LQEPPVFEWAPRACVRVCAGPGVICVCVSVCLYWHIWTQEMSLENLGKKNFFFVALKCDSLLSQVDEHSRYPPN